MATTHQKSQLHLLTDYQAVYEEQTKQRRQYVEESVLKTVSRLSGYLDELYDAFLHCGAERIGLAWKDLAAEEKLNPDLLKAAAEAHRDWSRFYESGSLTPYLRNQKSFHSRYHLNRETDLRDMAASGEKSKADHLKGKREHTIQILQEGIRWKSVQGNALNPADELYYFRDDLLQALDGLFLNKFNGTVKFPRPDDVKAARSQLDDELGNMANLVVEQRLELIDEVAKELLEQSEPKWMQLEEQLLEQKTPFRLRWQVILPSELSVAKKGNGVKNGHVDHEHELAPGLLLRRLSKELESEMASAGLPINVTTNYDVYKSNIYRTEKLWCIRPAEKVVCPIFGKENQCYGIEILTPMLNSEGMVPKINTLLQKLRDLGCRTNSTTMRSTDYVVEPLNLPVVKTIVGKFMNEFGQGRILRQQNVYGLGHVDEICAAVSPTGYERVDLTYAMRNRGEGSFAYIRINSGSGGAPDEHFGANFVRQLTEVSRMVEPTPPEIQDPTAEPSVTVTPPVVPGLEMPGQPFKPEELVPLIPARTKMSEETHRDFISHLEETERFFNQKKEAAISEWWVYAVGRTESTELLADGKGFSQAWQDAFEVARSSYVSASSHFNELTTKIAESLRKGANLIFQEVNQSKEIEIEMPGDESNSKKVSLQQLNNSFAGTEDDLLAIVKLSDVYNQINQQRQIFAEQQNIPQSIEALNGSIKTLSEIRAAYQEFWSGSYANQNDQQTRAAKGFNGAIPNRETFLPKQPSQRETGI